MTILHASLLFFLLTAGAFLAPWLLFVRRLFAQGRIPPALALGLLLLSAVIMVRPHADSLVGLDTSCYRMMTRAFLAGRPFRSVDAEIGDVPPGVRPYFYLEGTQSVRTTRDRSFEIISPETLETVPFFYPTLSLAAAGFSRALFGVSPDLLTPFLAALFLWSWLLWGWTSGRGLGLAAAFALWIGSPLPVWILRGYFAEGFGMLLLMPVLAGWLAGLRNRAFLWPAAFAMGLAASVHPLMAVVAAPLWFLVGAGGASRARLGMAGWFMAGLAPLLIMTRLGCSPYGNFLDPAEWLSRLRNDSALRYAVVLGTAVALAGGAFWLAAETSGRYNRWATGVARCLRVPVVFGGAVILSSATVLLLVHRTPAGAPAVNGLHEFLLSIRWPLGLLILVGLAGTSNLRRARLNAAVLLAIGMAPLFFHLKGIEQIGMWSQRRLFPLWVLCFVPLLPGAIRALQTIAGPEQAGRRRRSVGIAAALLLAAFAGLANPIRWPDPWRLRAEQGVDAWIEDVELALDGRMTVMDYHHYSLPFAVMARDRVFGLSGLDGWAGLDLVSGWMKNRLAKEPVLWGTAYANPGIEAGVALVGEERVNIDLLRLRANTALPAKAYTHRVRVELLRLEPADPMRPPALDKILDGGPLALRGNWLRRNRTLAHDEHGRLPAWWSRQGAAVIGPVPPSGGPVQVTVYAVSGRETQGQTLEIHPPWGGDPAVVSIRPEWTEAVVELIRPEEDRSRRPTGEYRLHAPVPYNPEDEGIHGFAPDLGALIHRIRIDAGGMSNIQEE